MKTPMVVIVVLIVAIVGLLIFMQFPATTEAPTVDTGSQGKIDINAVCDGALAYMSFPSGAEAEAWVEACKRGEHPEAIEQWKQMQGIEDDRAI